MDLKQMQMQMQMQGKDIPEPVVMEILTRLPVKSLARFRCVCKPWASSFRTSCFIKKHYRTNNSPLKLILLENPRGRGMAGEYTLVYGPCNGVLCLFDTTDESLHLWNPSTREYRAIPKSTVTVQPPPSAGPCRSFEYGFGYDSLTDDYKLVRIRMFDHINQADLYSLKAHSWKQISPPGPCPHSRPFRMLSVSCCVNGFYHWPALSSHKRHIILSFDMANEKFSTLPLSFDSNSNEHLKGQLELLDFNGSLGVVIFWPERFLDIWVMMNGSWTKHFSMDPFPDLGVLLGFSKIGEIFFTSLNSDLALLDPATKEIKNLGVSVDRYSLKLIAYDETFVSINGTSDREHFIRRPAGNIQIDSEDDDHDDDSKPRIYML